MPHTTAPPSPASPALRPFVRMKIAASLDGRTALNNGVSKWITGPEARQDGHRWRAQADAILTGIGTVLADDPLLNVRDVEVTQQPALVIVDSRLETPPNAQLFRTSRTVLIYSSTCNPEKQKALELMGASVIFMPENKTTVEPPVDLNSLMSDLKKRRLVRVHVEAGSRLSGTFIQAGFVDELLFYFAPMLLGPGCPVAKLPELTSLGSAARYELIETVNFQHDLMVRYRISNTHAKKPPDQS